MRKSSRGNPWHDEKGRFCSGSKAVSTSERNYETRQEAISRGEYDKDSARDLRQLTKRAIESPDGGSQNEWEIRRGGYDKWYEVYNNGEPAFGVIDGEVEVYQEKHRAYAEDFASVSGYPISAESCGGSGPPPDDNPTEVDGPLQTRVYIEKYVKEHPGIKNEAPKYMYVLEAVKSFQENHPDSNNGTFDKDTGEPVDLTEGYQLTFHQNLSLENRLGGYTKEEYAYMCAITMRELKCDEVYIGCFGNPEVSFTCLDYDTAMSFAQKHNQNSIWDNSVEINSEDDIDRATIINTFYNPATNPTD